ncbi:uncharacterized protein LOC110841796 [Folsomia candida]|uniref:uncharacterized protein LOC110841796 n=1 Tax=Folsomia candida TaxID=158441 RepID=UPI000B8FCA81|nr:uncharacterized protein LOC110841796 [Folsomia candida]
MEQSHNITFDQIKKAGILRSPFTAKVNLIEEKRLTDAPYLKLMLTQDEGANIIVVMAMAYEKAKITYETGKQYQFDSGMFRVRAKNQNYRSWSTFNFDLWFLRDETAYRKELSSQRSVRSNFSASHRPTQVLQPTTSANADNNWRS